MHQNQFQIRSAILPDAAAIAKLSNQLGYQSSAVQTQQRLSLVLNDPNSQLWVATIDDHVVGWIHGFYAMRVESDPFIEIGGLVVDEPYRRHYLGKILVHEVLEWAATKDIKRVRVRCNKIRKESHLFYKALGFEEMKEQKVMEI